jgi:hypothetical protein
MKRRFRLTIIESGTAPIALTPEPGAQTDWIAIAQLIDEPPKQFFRRVRLLREKAQLEAADLYASAEPDPRLNSERLSVLQSLAAVLVPEAKLTVWSDANSGPAAVALQETEEQLAARFAHRSIELRHQFSARPGPSAS